MKDDFIYIKKNTDSAEKLNSCLVDGGHLQMQNEGVILRPLSKKITHSGARLGLAGRSFVKV